MAMVINLADAARVTPRQAALIAPGIELDYAGLEACVSRRAEGMAAQGISAGDRIAVTGAATVEAVLTIYALWLLGATVVPLHPRLTLRERARLLQEADAVEIPPPNTPVERRGRDGTPAPLAILFTSGTTGRPKAAVLPAPAFAAAAHASAERLGWHTEDRWLLSLAPAHVGGLAVLVRCLLGRRAVVIGESTPATVAASRVTLLSLVPTQLHRWLESSVVLPAHVRAILIGGAPCPPPMLSRARRLGWPVLPTYGLTEACAQVATQQPDAPDDDGVGPPLPGVGVRISDEGTIQLSGPTLFARYLHHPTPFTGDGWFETGDLGSFDDRGRLHVFARRHDLILSGGENVYPAEVEAALLGLPGIDACCVFGQADAEWGQVVCAAIECISPGPCARTLHAYLSTELAPWKRPRAIAVLPALPRLPSGKMDRMETIRLAVPRLQWLDATRLR